ncbi:MAG: hypothetical protein KGI50_06920 [Patescibacteria group bacterium]|nr:hypothetical protein [Patescibacteria group bacterium]MDE2438816.1 hypothetical protein [Patescibacteria group bacterium]
MPEAVTAVTAHDGYLIILEGNKLSLVWPPELGILAVPKIWNMCTTSEKIIIVKALPALKVDMGKEINKLLDYHDINGKSKI